MVKQKTSGGSRKRASHSVKHPARHTAVSTPQETAVDPQRETLEQQATETPKESPDLKHEYQESILPEAKEFRGGVCCGMLFQHPADYAAHKARPIKHSLSR